MAVLLGKPRIQPLYAPVLLELSQRAGAELRQRTAIQLQQLFPQLRVMLSQLPQLADALERAAPAGRTVVYLIQPAEVKATVVTGLERLRLRDAPFHEGIPLILAAPRFIGGDADIVDRAQLAFEPVDLLGDKVRFELPGTPADTDSRPAVAVGRDAQLCAVFQTAGLLLGFIEHQDTDHVGAVEADSPGLFRDATLYVGEIENRYLTGETRRKVIYHLYKLPQVTIHNEKVLLRDGEVLDIDGIKIECFLVPGHTWGHMVYLIDDNYLFTGDTIWFGADGGYSFISALAEDNKLAARSLAALEEKLRARGLNPVFLTGHTGWTDNFAFAFSHKEQLCSPFGKRVHDPNAPYDAYDESDDTEQSAKSGLLQGVGR